MRKKYDYNKIQYGFYDKIYKNKKGIRSAWHHIKFNFLKDKIKNKNKHLDIGCGSGTFVNLLKNEYSVGIDISKKQIEFANKIYGSKKKRFVHYKNKIPFKLNSFDSISLIELIEHLSNKEIKVLMNEVYKALKKNGKVFITTPNYLSLWPLLEVILNTVSEVKYEDQHINKFNFYKLKKVINKKRFRVKQLNSFMVLSPFLAFFSFKFSIFFSKYENLLTKIFPGFLLFIEIEKK